MASQAWARRGARVLSFFAVSALASISAGAEKDEPATADACVSFQQETIDKALVVEAANDCQKGFACRLDYTVRCTDLDGKQTSKLDKRAPFGLSPKGKAKVTLSAGSCLQGWRIDDFSWTCG
ncbi:MAG: hypothetical protein EOO73_22245 [Myxococcales bacterium]|nr:MAG: hypothetical protein EOO73_22245 [Myxococcales bacterium]